MIYSSENEHKGATSFTEANAEATGVYMPRGHELIELMLSDKI